MLCYRHDKKKALEASQGKPTELVYPSGHNHVLKPNGQHVNPRRCRGSKKERLAARRSEKTFSAAFCPVSLMPLGTIESAQK